MVFVALGLSGRKGEHTCQIESVGDAEQNDTRVGLLRPAKQAVQDAVVPCGELVNLQDEATGTTSQVRGATEPRVTQKGRRWGSRTHLVDDKDHGGQLVRAAKELIEALKCLVGPHVGVFCRRQLF